MVAEQWTRDAIVSTALLVAAIDFGPTQFEHENDLRRNFDHNSVWKRHLRVPVRPVQTVFVGYSQTERIW